MGRALLLVDIQQDYFPGGAFPLVGPEAAADAARVVLDAFRTAGETVVHVRHADPDEHASFLRAGTPGARLHPRVEPVEGEPVVVKQEPNAFVGTDLEALLRSVEVDRLVIVGMMTSMCIDSTTRAAAELGFAPVVVGDACAAPDLAFGGTTVPGAAVHAAFLAALDGAFATVVPSASFHAPAR